MVKNADTQAISVDAPKMADIWTKESRVHFEGLEGSSGRRRHSL
jgi:hypothetical protein